MAGQQPVSRRRALETIGVTTTAVGLPTAGAVTAEDESSPETERLPSETEVSTELTGFYTGTVDRIVDDEHVVILVETDKRVIDQHVVPAKDHPSLEARDGVYLFILFGEVIAIWEVSGE
jgi:hypothetical protein